MAAVGRYRNGNHFLYASDYVCLSRTHSKPYVLSLSFVDQSLRSPSLAPLYLYRTLSHASEAADFRGGLVYLSSCLSVCPVVPISRTVFYRATRHKRSGTRTKSVLLLCDSSFWVTVPRAGILNSGCKIGQ